MGNERFHPKTWEDGIMPLSEFPPEYREHLEQLITAPEPPPRWFTSEFFRAESRAWHEWHWRRGRHWWTRTDGGEIIRGNPDTRPAIPQRIRAEIYERDGYKCVHCGAESDLTLDHIHPWSMGGADTPDNLQTLCRSCNSRKGARV